MHAKKVILWDFDGTLGFRSGGWSELLAEVFCDNEGDARRTANDFRPLLRDGFPWHTPRVARVPPASPALWWSSLREVLARAYVGVGLAPAKAEHYATLAQRKYLDPAAWFLFDDTFPALRELHDAGWTHAVLSNHVPELAQIVERLGLGGYVSHVFTSACTGYEKPHPRAFATVLQALGHPTQVWMVGDNYQADVLGAEAAGIPAILVRCPHREAARCCRGLLEAATLVEQEGSK